ncbi:hypothetical protein ACJJTC_009513 [Scirpophaga incertulas]
MTSFLKSNSPPLSRTGYDRIISEILLKPETSLKVPRYLRFKDDEPEEQNESPFSLSEKATCHKYSKLMESFIKSLPCPCPNNIEDCFKPFYNKPFKRKLLISDLRFNPPYIKDLISNGGIVNPLKQLEIKSWLSRHTGENVWPGLFSRTIH